MRGYLDKRGRWHPGTQDIISTRDSIGARDDGGDFIEPPGLGQKPPGSLSAGGGADLAKYDTTKTDLSLSDDFTTNNDEKFQSSDLDKPSASTESWRQLDDQMEPSDGAGSGNIKKNSMHNDAQWLRRFSLIVYSKGGGSSGEGGSTGGDYGGGSDSGDYGGGGDSGDSLRLEGYVRNGKVVLFRPRRSPRDDPTGGDPPSIDLPPVDVTAPAPEEDYGGGGDTPKNSDTSGGDKTAADPPAAKNASQPGIDLSNLRCTFSVQKTTAATPNMLYARIYNMAPATMGKVIEFTRVQVQAGYKYANYGLIFDGRVIQYRRGKENPVDTYLEIHAGDGLSMGDATVMESLEAGSTREDVHKKLIEAQKKLEQIDTEKVDQTNFKEHYQRRRILLGQVHDLERKFNQEDETHSFIENGKYSRILKTSYLDNEAVVLTPRTGLVGLPEVTPQGIQIKCLLNPKLKLGGLVQIDNKVLSGVAFTPGTQAATDENGNVTGPGQPTGGMPEQPGLMDAGRGQTFETAFTSPVGRYKILLLTFSGDTRGNPWYADMICVALNSKGQAMLFSNQSNAWSRASPDAHGTTEIASRMAATATRRVVPMYRRIDNRVK